MAAAVELELSPRASSKASCPGCGASVASAEVEDARRRIVELEAQMERLKEKATAAVDRCADYEDQLRTLKAHSDTATADEPARPTTSSSTRAASRFSFLTNRFPSPASTGAMPPPPAAAPPIDYTLLNELERERALRAKAEARVQTVDSEIEELSVQLFSQANEMVAEERRARAKLEERVETLERRDREKMGRLDRLEKAVSRVERVKALLGEKDRATREAENASGMLSPPARR
ncbi:hypothetical protein BDW02DRAFT_243152 [Decorospora gaudefroyi]|uniref:GDP/GTP exchange factor Sec2 N-terminal domain-containing protein n=1 Tax=Decorospora gaudefroyi TaxID=184978 RepID=A0A6A5JY74_9PLEO|nr:hypothetical protein BDW02DRAFT_243152 [Decorospora gaudefroyi]